MKIICHLPLNKALVPLRQIDVRKREPSHVISVLQCKGMKTHQDRRSLNRAGRAGSVCLAVEGEIAVTAVAVEPS